MLLYNVKRLYGNLSLKGKIAIFFSLSGIVLLVVQGGVIYNYSTRTIENEMINSTRQTIEQVSLNIDSYFGELKTIIETTSSNKTLIEAVENYNSDFSKQLEYDQNLHNILDQYTYMIPYIEDVLVIKDGRAIYNKNNSTRSDFNFDREEWYSRHLSEWVKATFVGPHMNNYYYSSQPEYVISAIIPVRNVLEGSKKNVGALVFDIDINKINSIFGKLRLDDSQNAYIVDLAGNIISSKNYSLIGDKFDEISLEPVIKHDKGYFMEHVDNDNLLVVYSTSSNTGWKTVITTNMSKVDEVAGRVRMTTMVIICSAIIIAMILSTLISAQITKSISALKSKMDEVSKGNYKIDVQIEHKDEVGMLGEHFNNMVKELKKLINENYIVKIKQKDAELNALQAKINPHFLNNTLQAIHSMAVLKRTRDIETTIESLSKLFDYVLYESGKFVQVKDEICYLESYFKILKGNNKRFQYVIHVDERAESLIIPKLLLQPLAENALVHGLQKKLSDGLISIMVADEGDRISFLVSDNGKGMTREELDKVYRIIHNEDLETNSIGLRNVYERLKLRYGKDAVFEIQTKPFEGTCITLKIPKECGNADHNHLMIE